MATETKIYSLAWKVIFCTVLNQTLRRQLSHILEFPLNQLNAVPKISLITAVPVTSLDYYQAQAYGESYEVSLVLWS